MKKIKFLLIMLAFFGLSNVYGQGSGIGYDYIVEEGADFTLLASDYGGEITIGVPNGGDFELYAPVGSSGQQFGTENCGATTSNHITTCGPGTYSCLTTGNGTIDIEIIWYGELGESGEDFFAIAGSDTTITISSNFVYVWWGETGQSGYTESHTFGPLVPGKQYYIGVYDAANHITYDTCTISQAVVPTYDATFTVTESGTGTAIGGASVSCNSLAQTTNASGQTVFTNLEDGSYPYSVTADGYVTETGSVIVNGANTDVEVSMAETLYNLEFTVKIAGTATPIEGASVTVTGEGTVVTSSVGTALFELPAGDYSYTVTADGYVAETGDISLFNHMPLDVEMTEQTAPTYNVEFTVKEGATPIEDASVIVTGHGTVVTGSAGTALFVLPAGDYDYEVVVDAYLTESGNFTVANHMSIDVDMTPTAVADITGANVSVYPNPVTSTLFIKNADEFNAISIYDISGKIIYSANISETAELDFSNITKGLYFVKLSGAKKVSVTKVSKN